MADKKKISVPTPKSKRPSTTSVAGSSRSRISLATGKDRMGPPRERSNLNATKLTADTTLAGHVSTEFEEEYHQIALNKFLKAMLEDCLVDEKIEREETEIDVQMTHLANRFQQTVEQLDKTSKRLNSINFIVEQQRLLDLKKQDTSEFYDVTNKTNVADIVDELQFKEQASLDRLDTKNVDFGYDKNSGHKQLLDAVNDAILGLEEIKKHSQLDMNKFKLYENAMDNLQDIEKDRFNLEMMKKEFEVKFPNFTEKLLKHCSNSISKMMDNPSDHA